LYRNLLAVDNHWETTNDKTTASYCVAMETGAGAVAKAEDDCLEFLN